jgi:hypothetical protein
MAITGIGSLGGFTAKDFEELYKRYPSVLQPSVLPPWDPAHSHSHAGLFMSDNERRYTESNMTTMLASRMGWTVNAPANPFRKVAPIKLNDEKIAIFVVHGDKALVLQDEVGLFPSDALVTQLRLLAEG